MCDVHLQIVTCSNTHTHTQHTQTRSLSLSVANTVTKKIVEGAQTQHARTPTGRTHTGFSHDEERVKSASSAWQRSRGSFNVQNKKPSHTPRCFDHLAGCDPVVQVSRSSLGHHLRHPGRHLVVRLHLCRALQQVGVRGNNVGGRVSSWNFISMQVTQLKSSHCTLFNLETFALEIPTWLSYFNKLK